MSSFCRTCSLRTSFAVKMETNGAGAAAFSTFGRPFASSRSTRHIAPTTSNPNSRAASIAWIVDAPVVQTSSTITTRAPFSLETLDALSGAVLLLGFANEEAVEFAADHRNRHHDRVRAHRQAADGLRFPPALPDLFQENFPCQPRTFGIECRGAAVDVIVAGPAGGKFELTQLERLVSERGEQFLTRGMHKNLRYHGRTPPRELDKCSDTGSGFPSSAARLIARLRRRPRVPEPAISPARVVT